MMSMFTTTSKKPVENVMEQKVPSYQA